MDYNKLLEQLRMGEIDEFELESDQFQVFYEIWRSYPYQNAIRGIAGRNGLITYRRAEISEELTK
ncbi:hypothetical protein G7084_06750 [Weissella coleopterorum]|uniref:Uncharacterized protein n=1 Tax=Weissella coleopterorum TaxID=2714949 RepID=A0A6G8B103_9LACO|nr:hypothetical protein [Weissella coleopterorum]QIL51021.1 hypothetical protein G7084_06750 [Weissella coleopterorum]